MELVHARILWDTQALPLPLTEHFLARRSRQTLRYVVDPDGSGAGGGSVALY